jgi:hypothetical protein
MEGISSDSYMANEMTASYETKMFIKFTMFTAEHQ